MKKYNNFTILIFSMFMMIFFSGCAGTRTAKPVYDQKTNMITSWNDTNYSFIEPSIGPTDLARANKINSQAAINNAIAQQIKKGNSAEFSGKFVGVIVNQDPFRTAKVFHPEKDEIREIAPGEYSVFMVSIIPDYIHVRFSGQKKNIKMKIYKKYKPYNGINTHFGARIESS